METEQEERDRLFATYVETRSEKVRNELVESYAPLAEFFAKRYRNRGAESDDLRQVGQLALVKAVERFDPEFGVKFSTFAGRTIDAELKRYFRDRTWSVRVPRSLQERSLEVRRTVERLSLDLGRAPTVDQLAEATGLSSDEVLEALDVQSAYTSASLDRPTGNGDDGDLTLGASLGSDDDAYEATEAAVAVRSLLDTLPDRERRILELRFFGELSQSEIAEQVGISQMHVSRLLRRTLEQLRSTMTAP